jgi:hypothetical protein
MIELDDDAVQAIREGALPGMRFADDWHAIDDAARVMQIFFKPDPPPAHPAPAPAPVERAPRRPRKPNLDRLLAKAKAAGATSVTVDGVEMRFGEPGAATSSNPWDAEIARLTQ